MSVNVLDANFEDLLAAYYHGTQSAATAAHLRKLIDANKQMQLAALLRDHRKKSVYSPREIKLRAGTDQLLLCCSVMEIASLTGFIRDVHNTEFGKSMLDILANSQVRRYYEDYYPTKLPQLFRCRLVGAHSFVDQTVDHYIPYVLTFLDLDRRFMEQLEDGYLLRMLDSFTIEGYTFDDIVKLIAKPEEFVERLLLPPKKRDALSEAVNEFSAFMQFCFDLLQLLTAIESPLIRSAIWNHYTYWFEIIGDQLKNRLGKALSQFLQWKPRENDDRPAQEVSAYVLKANEVLNTLISLEFAEPIYSFLRQAVEVDQHVTAIAEYCGFSAEERRMAGFIAQGYREIDIMRRLHLRGATFGATREKIYKKMKKMIKTEDSNDLLRELRRATSDKQPHEGQSGLRD